MSDKNYTFIFSEELNLDQRYICVYGDIEGGMASSVLQALKEMENLNHDPITIYIESYGGDSYLGLSIIEAMRTSECLINTVCRGIAASIAAEIFSAGDHRVMAKNSILMYHKSKCASDLEDASAHKIAATELERLDKVFAERLAERSNKGKAWWLKRIRQDFYVNAEQAKKLGLVEDII